MPRPSLARRGVLGSLLAVLTGGGTLRAATFTATGPDGGTINCLAADHSSLPATLYACTDSGVFKTTSGGASWASASTGGLAGAGIISIALDPTSLSTLYAGTGNAGLFKTTNGGASWAAVGGAAVAQSAVRGLALDPSNPSTLFATTSGELGVVKSTDGGASFAAAGAGLPSSLGYGAIAVNPNAPNQVYVGTDGDARAFLSTDQGATWTEVSGGLEGAVSQFSFPLPVVIELRQELATGATAYAATGAGLFSWDGTGWTSLTGLLCSPLLATIDCDFHFLKQTDAGRFLAGGAAGVYLTTDDGASWTRASSGLPAETVLSLAQSTQSTLFVGLDGDGVFGTIDGGASWTSAARGLAAVDVSSLAVDASAAVILVGRTGAVSRSTDGGLTWATLRNGLPSSSADSIALVPGTSTTFYTGTQDGLYKTTNGGTSFDLLGGGVPCAPVAINPVTTSTLYAGGCASGIVKSTDAGATWATASAGFAGDAPSSLAVDPRTLTTVYAASSTNGVFKSTNGGATWTAVNSNDPSGWLQNGVFSLAIDPVTTATLYAGHGHGIAKSTNGGASWTNVTQGLQVGPSRYPSVTDLAIDPRTTTTVYAGTLEDGLFRSTDAGASWAPYNDGLGSLSIGGLAVGGSPTFVFVGTHGSSVFRTTLPPPPPIPFLPSTAHAPGAGGAFYTTSVTVANTGATTAVFSLKFLGHDKDGTSGPEQTFTLEAGKTRTFSDVLGSVFGVTNDYGALRIITSTTAVKIVSVTSTPGFGGTFGQTVPPSSGADLVGSTPRTILAVREDTAFRTNLVLCNTTFSPLDVDVLLMDAMGQTLASSRVPLKSLGMTQLSGVVRKLGVAANVTGARLVLSTSTPGGSFAAFTSVIDNVTNDPTTVVPSPPQSSVSVWYLPSTAHAPGAPGSGAFYTTAVAVSNTGPVLADYTFKFLGHDADGSEGLEVRFTLDGAKSQLYADILGSVFSLSNAYGAIQVSAGAATPLALVSLTSTPGFGGTFGQTVPAISATDLLSSGTSRSILSVREDAAFRSNLVLCNATSNAIDVDVALVDTEGVSLGGKRVPVQPLGMTQLSHVVRALGVTANVTGARLVLSTPTVGGAFSAFLSLIDNVTNDPTTIVPQ